MRYIQKDIDRFWSRVGDGPFSEYCGSSCREWKKPYGAGGYGTFSFEVEGKWINVKAHRVAWELTYGEIPPGMLVCHKCDNRPCCEPTHLFVGTHQDNSDDMFSKGREPEWLKKGNKEAQGSKHLLAKLTEAQVLAIRQQYADCAGTQQQIADRHGISRTTVEGIVNRRRWRHI